MPLRFRACRGRIRGSRQYFSEITGDPTFRTPVLGISQRDFFKPDAVTPVRRPHVQMPAYHNGDIELFVPRLSSPRSTPEGKAWNARQPHQISAQGEVIDEDQRVLCWNFRETRGGEATATLAPRLA